MKNDKENNQEVDIETNDDAVLYSVIVPKGTSCQSPSNMCGYRTKDGCCDLVYDYCEWQDAL